jgi:uncharacterized protein (DUF608 family)
MHDHCPASQYILSMHDLPTWHALPQLGEIGHCSCLKKRCHNVSGCLPAHGRLGLMAMWRCLVRNWMRALIVVVIANQVH